MPPTNTDLLRSWFEDIWNRGDVDAADRLLAANGILHETALGADGTQDLAAFKTMARTFRQAIPDIRFHVDATVANGDHVAGRVTATGTHSGPGLGFPPTGRTFRITGIVMIRVSEGRTIEGWSSFDMLGLYEQLGVLKRPRIGPA